MPLRKEIKTLKQLSIDVINDTPLYPTHWFRALPPSLLEELILYPIDTNQSLQLYPPDKWRLIRKEITRLEIEFQQNWKREWSVNILKAAIRTCQGLTHLSLENTTVERSDTSILTHDDYFHFVRYIPNIIVLEIIGTQLKDINDDILKAIGDNCPKLENLYLPKSAISDKGIRRFCRSKSRGSNLKYLDLKYSNIKVKGVIIALRNLKQLREFNNGRVIDAFKKMYEKLDKSQELPKFQLFKLPRIVTHRVPSGFLQFVTKCCPNVPDLDIYASNSFADAVIEIRKCDKILPFSLLVREGSLTQEWADVGSKLTYLNIDINGIDLSLLGLSCPNLQELFLRNYASDQPVTNVMRINERIPFSQLLKLSLNGSFPKTHLNFLLQNCLSLEMLSMSGTTEVNDDDMISILHKVNPLRHLTHFTICDCHNLTKRIIMELLLMENNLEFIYIERCNLFSDFDIIEVESHIKKNNFGIDVITEL